MITKADIVKQLLAGKSTTPVKAAASAFAPSNIALIKYWGKRNHELNLPLTSSLSLSLDNKGTTTTLNVNSKGQDSAQLNGQAVSLQSSFALRLFQFLALFRADNTIGFEVITESSIPIAAGLASSASGFAALVKVLNILYGWQADHKTLSILARLGSGSACRSLFDGFVKWQKGRREDGMDSYAKRLPIVWPEFCMGLLIVDEAKKVMSSREAMAHTVKTSVLYQAWPKQVAQDLKALEAALAAKDFKALGSIAEHNALSMHATMLASNPAICYSTPDTLKAMQRIWALRAEGLPLYFTQDAGPNLKLLFLQKDKHAVQQYFPQMH